MDSPEKGESCGTVAFKLKLEDNGEPLIRHPAWNAPVLARGLLYVRGKDRLVCLDLTSAPSP